MKASLLLCVLLLAAFLNAIACAALDPLTLMPKEDWERYENLEWEERSWVPRLWPAEKVNVLLEVFKEASKADDGDFWEEYADDLVFLGDEEAIELSIAGKGRGDALLCARNPRLVPKMAPMLYKEEGRNSDFFRPSASVSTAMTIMELISRTPEFPKEVQDWAASANGSPSKYYRSGLLIVRKWWETNHQELTEGRYADVKVGEAFPQDVPGHSNETGPLTQESAAPANIVKTSPPSSSESNGGKPFHAGVKAFAVLAILCVILFVWVKWNKRLAN